MPPLNLPPVHLKTALDPRGRTVVFDPFRKQYVRLTPEENVRQHFLQYLVRNLGYPAGLIAVEHTVVINGLRQRADIVVFNNRLEPQIIVECKAPDVAITQTVFDQALRYNTRLGVRYIIVTNGLKHFCAQIDGPNQAHLLTEIPAAGGQ